ncbi:MAG: glycosyltransferase, partial [Pedobacter sp.]
MNKISIVTATYNADKFLSNLIESIKVQGDVQFEFIIIDGGSKDKTISIIKQNEEVITKWISEKDNGIYDAWNKGIALATGNWIMFLGADDMLLPQALAKYYKFINEHDTNNLELISSKKQMIDTNGKLIRTTGFRWEWPLFLKYMTIAHPGALHSTRLFKKYGIFDIKYKICGDYELLLRAKDKLVTAFFDEVTVKMSEGGASDSIKAINEYYRVTTTTGGLSKFKGSGFWLLTLTKYITKKFLRKLGVNAYLK